MKECKHCGKAYFRPKEISDKQWESRLYCSQGCASTVKNKSHGLSGHPLFSVWQGIKSRCNNPRGAYYKDYGGRGIGICQEWEDSFIEFYHWAVRNGYRKGMQIDRTDNEKGYSPGNCRFVNSKTNNRNRRSNRVLTYKGESQPLIYWADKFSIGKTTLKERLNRGWSVDKAIETPVRTQSGAN